MTWRWGWAVGDNISSHEHNDNPTRDNHTIDSKQKKNHPTSCTACFSDDLSSENVDLAIVKKMDGEEGEQDVTNTSITVSFESRNVKFQAITSTPNPFPDLVPEWYFEGKKELPHGLQQRGLELSFMTIFRSNEQIGTYSITVGNFSAFFQLLARGEYYKL